MVILRLGAQVKLKRGGLVAGYGLCCWVENEADIQREHVMNSREMGDILGGASHSSTPSE